MSSYISGLISKATEGVNSLLRASGRLFSEENNSLDYSIYENAIGLLGLSEEEAQNKETIETRYNRRFEECRKRIKKLQDSGLHNLAKKIEEILNDVNIAYRTVQVVLEENKEEKE